MTEFRFFRTCTLEYPYYLSRDTKQDADAQFLSMELSLWFLSVCVCIIVVIKSVCVLNICKQIFSRVYTLAFVTVISNKKCRLFYSVASGCINSGAVTDFETSPIEVLRTMHVMVWVGVTSIQTHITAEVIIPESSSATPWLNKTKT